jgi:hypothetical protein
LGTLLVFAVAAVVSVFFLLQAAGTAYVPGALILLGLGAATGATGLLFVNEPITAIARRHRHLAAVAGLVLMLAGAWLVADAFRTESGEQAAVGVIGLMVGSLPVSYWFGSSHLVLPGVVALAGLPLIVVGCIGLGQFTAGDVELAAWLGSNRLAAASILFAGVALLKLGTSQWLDHPLWDDPFDVSGWRDSRVRTALWWGVWASVLGLVAMPVAAQMEHLVLFLSGLGVALTGLSVFALGGQRHRTSAGWWWLAGSVGGGMVIFGAWRAWSVLGEWGLMVLVAIAVVVATGAWFVFRGEGMFVLVLVGFVFAWVLHDRTVPPPEERGSGGVILAMGDSYISGQGDYTFHDGTNTRDLTEGVPCRHSPHAYPFQVGAELAMDVVSLACSGAEIDDVLYRAQYPEATGVGSRPQIEQLRSLDPEVKDRVEVVLVSAGGNDVGFGTIIPACLLPADCSEKAAFWLERARLVEGDLADLYRTLAAELPQAQVVAVPYPQLLDEEDCGLAVGDAERPFVVTFEKVLNSAIVGAAEQVRGEGARLIAFPYSFDALRLSGRLLCDQGRQGVNFIHLLPYEGSAAERLLPTHWKDGSLHPRREGHTEIAATLHPWLATGLASGFPVRELDYANLDLTPAELALTRPDEDTTVAEIEMAGDVDEGLRLEREAIVDQLWVTATSSSVAVSFLLVGGLLLAVASVQLSPRWRAIAAPDPPRR